MQHLIAQFLQQGARPLGNQPSWIPNVQTQTTPAVNYLPSAPPAPTYSPTPPTTPAQTSNTLYGVPNGYQPKPPAPPRQWSSHYGYTPQREPTQPWGDVGSARQNAEWNQFYNYKKGSPLFNLGMLSGHWAKTGRWGGLKNVFTR